MSEGERDVMVIIEGGDFEGDVMLMGWDQTLSPEALCKV